MLFEMVRDEAHELAATYSGAVEVAPSTDRDVCWLYPMEDGLRQDGGAVFTRNGDHWFFSTFAQTPFSQRGPVVNGLSLGLRTRGDQRVFEGVQPDHFMVKYVLAPGLDGRFLSHVGRPLFVATRVGRDAQPVGDRLEAVPLSTGWFERVPVAEALGGRLPAGVYEILAFFELHEEGSWQGRVESNRLIVEIRPEPQK